MPLRGYPNLALVNDSIRHLYANLKPACVKRFSNDSIYWDARKISWSDPVIATQHLARLIALNYYLPVTTVVVAFRSDIPVPGRVELSSSDEYFVEIHVEHRLQRDCIAAVLAHEIAHIFLHQHRIRLDPDFHNEVLTDTAAAYLGCGVLILNGVTETERSVGYDHVERQSRYFGYLTLDEFGYVLAKRDLLLGHDSSRCLTGIPLDSYLTGRNRTKAELGNRPFVARPLSDRLFYWVQCKLSGKNAQPSEVSRSIVFRCPCCSQFLRIPSSRTILSVHCPICDSQYRCYS